MDYSELSTLLGIWKTNKIPCEQASDEQKSYDWLQNVLLPELVRGIRNCIDTNRDNIAIAVSFEHLTSEAVRELVANCKAHQIRSGIGYEPDSKQAVLMFSLN